MLVSVPEPVLVLAPAPAPVLLLVLALALVLRLVWVPWEMPCTCAWLGSAGPTVEEMAVGTGAAALAGCADASGGVDDDTVVESGAGARSPSSSGVVGLLGEALAFMI